jgi:hypothetical protein
VRKLELPAAHGFESLFIGVEARADHLTRGQTLVTGMPYDVNNDSKDKVRIFEFRSETDMNSWLKLNGTGMDIVECGPFTTASIYDSLLGSLDTIRAICTCR